MAGATVTVFWHATASNSASVPDRRTKRLPEASQKARSNFTAAPTRHAVAVNSEPHLSATPRANGQFSRM
jgi:hypothetical protein